MAGQQRLRLGEQPGQPGTGAVATATAQPARVKSPAEYLVERLEKAGVVIYGPVKEPAWYPIVLVGSVCGYVLFGVVMAVVAIGGLL